MSDTELSVVIPTHNRKDLLRGMLVSLEEQTFDKSRFEVVVVDDGSTDGAAHMLEGLETSYLLRVLPQPQSGASRARNSGAWAARGDKVIFLDDDLLPEPQLLEEHVSLLEGDPSAVVLGRLLPWDRGDKGGWNAWEERVFQRHYRAMQAGDRPPGGRRLYSGNFSMWRERFLVCGGFDESLQRGEDVELGFRLEKVGCRFYFNPQAAAVHRGYRSFASWRRSAHLYGKTDVQLAQVRGHESAIDELARWFSHKPLFLQWMVYAALLARPVHELMVYAARFLAELMTRLRLERLSHLGYSVIFNLQYWRGATDELGGWRAFLQRIARIKIGGSPWPRLRSEGGGAGGYLASSDRAASSHVNAED